MRRLGLIGSLTAGTIDVYWQTINKEVLKWAGGSHPANVVVNCVNAPQLDSQLTDENWPLLTEILLEEAQGAARAGAEGLVICASALNPIASEISRLTHLPIFVPGPSVTAKLQNFSFRRVAVLGIRTLREERMWRSNLGAVAMVQPSVSDHRWLNRCADKFNEGHTIGVDYTIGSNQIVSALRRGGAQALVLADQALAHWIKADDTSLHPFNAAVIHAWAAALWSLECDRMPAPPCVLAEP
jgi:aspartate racemase